MAEEQDSGLDQVEEEYSVWKKNSPLLYEFVISHPLEWPSLTVHWSPLSPRHCSDRSLPLHRLVLGTHTSDGISNSLMVADVLLPVKSSEALPDPADPNAVLPKVEITQKIRVDGEVNKARFMPQKDSIVGAKTSSSEVFVFDCSKQEKRPQGGECDPDLRLKGHDSEGYGLSWSPIKEGYLLSGSHDCKVCVWDVSAMAQDKVLDAMHVFKGHEGAVGDVSWNQKNENLFGSVGDDCRLMIWDLRTNQSQHSVKAHEKEVNYLSFNPFNKWILATASSDTTVALFDLRKLTAPLHILSSHTEEVFQVEWDPIHETVLASSGDDRRLMVWDLDRIGDEQSEEDGDGDDGPPELLFSHGGHKAKISDFSWNKHEPWVISSVAEDNALQIWQLADCIYEDEYAGYVTND